MSPYLFSSPIPKHTFTHAYAQTHVHTHTLACKNTLTNVHVYICTLIHTYCADLHECLYVPEWRRTGTVTSCTTVPEWILQSIQTPQSWGAEETGIQTPETWFLPPLHCSLLNYVGCKSLNPLGQVSSPARWRHGRGLKPLGAKTQFFDKHEQWFQSLEGASSNPSFIWGISFIWKLCFLFCYSGEPCHPVGLSGD